LSKIVEPRIMSKILVERNKNEMNYIDYKKSEKTDKTIYFNFNTQKSFRRKDIDAEKNLSKLKVKNDSQEYIRIIL
jgi:hypothetical protein